LGVWIGSSVAVMVILVIIGVVVGVTAGAGGHADWTHDRGTMSVLIMACTLLFYFLALIAPVPYAISRSQNLIWGHPRSDEAWFLSNLSFEAMLKLTIKNWLLMVLTLGLGYFYWEAANRAVRGVLEQWSLVN